MTDLLQDLRFAFRWLSRSPGFAIAAMLTLALGIGANSAMFSIVNGVLLKPLPYPNPDRMVRIWSVNSTDPDTPANVNPLDFADWQKNLQGFSELAGFATRSMALTGGTAEPERGLGYRVTSSFFPALGAKVRLGRAFNPNDDLPGGSAIVVITDALWQRRFHADPNIIGKSLEINDSPHTIVGVTARDFRPLTPLVNPNDQVQLFVPLRIEDKMGRGGTWLNGFGRLRPGVSLNAARSELATLSSRLAREYPDTNKDRGVKLEGLAESLVGKTRAPMQILLASVALVLLIACVNVANLLLARGAGRSKEISLRAALGASSTRLARQLITENLLLALAGGALGLLLARWLLNLLIGLGLLDLPRLEEVRLDIRVLVFTLGVSLLTGLLFGLLPALRGAQVNLNANLQSASKGGGASGSRGLLHTLVIAETALALILIVGSGLLLKSFYHLLSVNTGFAPDHLLTARLQLPGSRYGEPQQQAAFYRELITRAATLPAARAVSAVDTLPFSGTFNCNSFTVEDSVSTPPDQTPCAEYRIVAPEYFSTMGIGVRRGRAFRPGDTEQSGYVAMINETLARSLWPDRDPVGRRITLSFDEEVSHQIIGVVADVRHFGLDKEAAPEVYVTLFQHPSNSMTLVVRTKFDPISLTPALRSTVRALDPQLPVSEPVSMDNLIAGSVAQPRLRTILLTLFAAIAMGLASVGIFGVMAYTVARRSMRSASAWRSERAGATCSS